MGTLEREKLSNYLAVRTGFQCLGTWVRSATAFPIKVSLVLGHGNTPVINTQACHGCSATSKVRT